LDSESFEYGTGIPGPGGKSGLEINLKIMYYDRFGNQTGWSDRNQILVQHIFIVNSEVSQIYK
jgi:hypothetical protein